MEELWSKDWLSLVIATPGGPVHPLQGEELVSVRTSDAHNM